MKTRLKEICNVEVPKESVLFFGFCTSNILAMKRIEIMFRKRAED